MRYKALPRDAEIDPEVALLQGASALDAAAEVAEKLNDVEGLLNVSAMWMKFSESIQGFTDRLEEAAAKAEHKAKEGEIVRTSTSKIEMGFQPEPAIIIEENEEDGRVDAEE